MLISYGDKGSELTHKLMSVCKCLTQVDTLIHHHALLFMCSVPSFDVLGFEKKPLMLTNTTELLAIFRKVNLEMDDNIANVYCTYKSNIDCQRTYDTRTYNVRYRKRTTYNVRYRQRTTYNVRYRQRTT